MKAARLVVLGVAVAAGGIAAYLAAGSKAPPPPPPGRRAAAGDRRGAGRQVRSHPRSGDRQSQDIGWQTWPAGRGQFELHQKVRPAGRDRTNSSAPSCAYRCSRAIRSADPTSSWPKARASWPPCCRRACARWRSIFQPESGSRRLHPAGRPRRRHADAARQSRGKGDRRREIRQRHDLAQRARAGGRSGGRGERAARRSWSARPRRSN